MFDIMPKSFKGTVIAKGNGNRRSVSSSGRRPMQLGRPIVRNIINPGPAVSGGDSVKVSVVDTTAAFLDTKITAGSNIVLTILAPGGNESLEVAVSANPTFTSVTTTDFTATGIVNFTGATLNYTQVTQNFLSTPVQISCEGVPAFGAPFTAPALTQYAEVIVEYNNGIDPVVTKTIVTLFNGLTQVVPFVTPTDSGEITSSWAAGDLTVSITGGNPVFFSFTAIDSWCWYNGVSVNNYSNKIHIYNGDITENTNTTEINSGVNNYYDNTSTITNDGDTILNGDTTINNLTVTNITVAGTTLVPMAKKTYSWVAGAGATTVGFADASSVADSIIAGWTITSGTQVGFWEFDLSVPGTITVNSTATETGTIDFTYLLII